jgi:predicted SAM-dependent methyltransferase
VTTLRVGDAVAIVRKPAASVVAARRMLARIRQAWTRRQGPKRLRRAVAHGDVHLLLGSSATRFDGWVATDREFLDLLQPSDWTRFFQPASVNAMLAEHVWEHLSASDGLEAARTCWRYLRPGGYLRLAVPDGLHPSATYRSWVQPGGASPGQLGNGHKVLYTYRTLTTTLQQAGFDVRLLEWFDDAGAFHAAPWSPAAGPIRRSRLDSRNVGGALVFTSLIVDAFRPTPGCIKAIHCS